MLYYRFRPPSELAFKELLYDELYFTSTAECNDPFDSQACYQFSSDSEKWTRLLRLALADLASLLDQSTIGNVAVALSARCPMTLGEFLAMDLDPFFLQATEPRTNVALVHVCAQAVKAFVRLYQPASRYFVSFSKSDREPLLWSHYGGKHEGYCLVFRPIDGSSGSAACGGKAHSRAGIPPESRLQ